MIGVISTMDVTKRSNYQAPSKIIRLLSVISAPLQSTKIITLLAPASVRVGISHRNDIYKNAHHVRTQLSST